MLLFQWLPVLLPVVLAFLVITSYSIHYTKLYDYKDDRKLFLDACKRSILEDSAQEIIARRYHFNQTLLWLKMRIRYLGGQDARPLLGITMLDVTKYHEMEEELNHMKMKKSEDVSL